MIGFGMSCGTRLTSLGKELGTCIGAGKGSGDKRCSDDPVGDISTGLEVAPPMASGNGDCRSIAVSGAFVETCAGIGLGIGSSPVGEMDIDSRDDDTKVLVASFGSATEAMDVGICDAVAEACRVHRGFLADVVESAVAVLGAVRAALTESHDCVEDWDGEVSIQHYWSLDSTISKVSPKLFWAM